VLSEIHRWRDEGSRVAIARVVTTDGSAPRDPGATMVVREDGTVAGSVSGGCVEGAVVAESLAVLETGTPRLVSFGYSDDDAFAVGLTCGGVIGIFVAPEVPAVFGALEDALRADVPVALATVIATRPDGEDAGGPTDADGLTYRPDSPDADLPRRPIELGASLLVRADGSTVGTLGHPSLDRSVRRDALGALSAGHAATRNYGLAGEARADEVEVFLDPFVAPPRMIIFGAVDFTAALSRIAKVLGFSVTVCDARATFATRERFPMADAVVVDWPQRYLESVGAELGPRDAVCVLTHDAKFDVPAIVAAVRTRAGYIGAMGSRRTHADRLERLREAGLGEADLERVMAPIGLDLGARTPEEVAVAIVAEIIARQTGHGQTSLRDLDGPIHRRDDVASTATR